MCVINTSGVNKGPIMNDYSDNVNMFRMTAGLVYRIYLATSNRNSLDAQTCMLSETETISKLAQGKCIWGPKKCEWGPEKDYFAYIMHTLLLALRPMSETAILDSMSPDQRDMLKQAILASQLCPKPDMANARKERDRCKEKIRKKDFDLKTREKDVLPCQRSIIECAMLVAERWDTAQEEMHKWSNALGIPYDDAMIAKNDPIKKNKKDVSPQENLVPEPQPIIIPEPVIIEAKEEPKPRRGRPKGSKNRPREKVEPVVESPIPGQKLKKISTNGQGKSKQADVLYTADDRELWSLGKLAAELGMADEKTFSAKKANFLYRHKKDKDYEKLEKTIQNWFEKRGTSAYFRAENIEKLKKLFGPTVTKHRAKKVENPVVENPVEMPAPIAPEQPAPTAEEQVVHVETVGMEKPADMLAVKGTDAYLTKLMELYKAANAEQQKQQGLSEEYAAKAQTAKTNKEQAAQDAKDIKASMEEYQKIKDDLTSAEEVLHEAERCVKEQKDKLAEWMAQNKKYLEK